MIQKPSMVQISMKNLLKRSSEEQENQFAAELQGQKRWWYELEEFFCASRLSQILSLWTERLHLVSLFSFLEKVDSLISSGWSDCQRLIGTAGQAYKYVTIGTAIKGLSDTPNIQQLIILLKKLW